MDLLQNSFEEGDTQKYSRSDILRALTPPIVACASALPLLAWTRAPLWALVGDGVIFAAFMLLYGVCYVYCFVRRPDALRSEKFQLTKYAIDSQLFGDSATGLIEVRATATPSAKAPEALTNLGSGTDG
jgi:hypothetical protein